MKYYILAALYFIAILLLSTCGLSAAPIGMVTGPKTGTYISFGQDIATVAKLEGLHIDIKESGGSIDNLKRITSKGENAGLGIVQSDVLAFLGRSRNTNSQHIASNLRIVMPFYEEEIHILARKEIPSFEALEGKRVVVGMLGSGNMLTALNLFKLSNITPIESIKMPLPEGIVAVLTGDADAIIITGGAPITLLKNIDNLRFVDGGRNAYLLNSIHLLPITNKHILQHYDSSIISTSHYDFVSANIPTASVTAIMVSYDFSNSINPYYIKRCKQLTTLGYAMRNHISYLKSSAHPKWKQVDLTRRVSNWKTDKCFAKAFNKNAMHIQTQQHLLNIVKEGVPLQMQRKNLSATIQPIANK